MDLFLPVDPLQCIVQFLILPCSTVDAKNISMVDWPRLLDQMLQQCRIKNKHLIKTKTHLGME